MNQVTFFKRFVTLAVTVIFSFSTLIASPTADVPDLSIISSNSSAIVISSAISKLVAVLDSKQISYQQVSSLTEATGRSIIIVGSGKVNVAASIPGKKQSVASVPEAVSIYKTTWKSKPVWVINGFDDRGTMYGILDVADRISWSTSRSTPLSELKETNEKPDVTDRAISIYTMNRAYWESRFYDEAYWNTYLDMLAKNRFNTLVVIFGYENGGFLAPCYPYFFNVEGFDQVRMIGIKKEEQDRNLAALNKLIRMTHEHGLRFTVGIWDHIYRGGVQGGGIPGTKDSPDKPVPGLVWGLNGDNLTAYTKAALAKFVKEFPGLDAIQFRMHNESGLKEGEQESFWSDIFRLFKKTSPDLRLDLRAKELPESVIASAIREGINFRITTKHWMEQMGMPYHPTQINPEKSPRRHSYSDLLRYPKEYKMHWRLWNGGTSRVLLWGDPEFARRFAASTHLYDGDGYEVNEPLATKMEAQPHDAKPFDLLNEKYRYYTYEFERYWHFFQVFGRMGYNPKTPSAVWDHEFQNRFGKQAGTVLEQALHKASWILPRIIASSYPYSSFPMTRGWAEKQRLGDLPSFARAEGSDLMQFATFDEEAKIMLEGGETAKIRPTENSRWFMRRSREVDSLVTIAEALSKGSERNNEFISTVADLKILSALAEYHAHRIPAAVMYRLFERGKDPAALTAAIEYEMKAVNAWRRLVAAAGDIYTNNLMMGVCVADLCGHWRDELVALEKGLTDLEQKKSALPIRTSLNNRPAYLPNGGEDNRDLFRIVHKPVISAAAGKPLTIVIKIAGPAAIKSVRLRYRSVNQEQSYKSKEMTPGSEKDLYQVTIPAEDINPRWDFMYLFEVIDKNGRGMIYPDLNKETPYFITTLKR